MPAEDRRAPPPVTRAGRKAAASEKRPRGRPRKDGVGGRAAPPPPPAPPLPKSRKKGRSRGQAQVEDEEGVDAAEKKPPPDKTSADQAPSGRRSSASRRRSRSEPVPEAPLPLPPASVSEEEAPERSARAPPLSPRASPSPAESVAGSGPPPSPRLRSEDAASPLFRRRSASEDSGSPAPSPGHTERRLRQCAFCHHGDRPALGQGPLVVFGPTPGYIPLHVLSRRTSSDRDGDCHDLCYRRGQGAHTSSGNSPAHCDGESSSLLLEQLGAIGLPRDVDVQSLFDPTGQCCAHFQCAAWSEGVRRGEGQSLLYVDKAIDSGSAQVCVFCGGFGASLRCQETGCGRSYHFPCAAAAGAHQDWESRRTLCTRHAHAAARSCTSCLRGGDDDDVGDLLMCCVCGRRYHARCLAPPLTPSSLIRAGWQCSPCRACQICRSREDTSVLLVCARCDKAYHAHCLTPPLGHAPDGNWTCQNCRVCLRCGVRSAGPWANHPFLCVSCDPALPCPLCGRAPDPSSTRDDVTCACCYRCVHGQCVAVEQAGVDATQRHNQSYVCSTCRLQKARVEKGPAGEPPPVPARVPRVESPTEILSVNTTARSPGPPSRSGRAPSPTGLTGASPESPMPSASAGTELRQSPTSSGLGPTGPGLDPVPSPPGPTDLGQSPALSPSGCAEQRASLVPSPSEPTELRPSRAPSPSDATEPEVGLVPSPSERREGEQRATASPTCATAQRASPPLSPSEAAEIRQSPTSWPPWAEPFKSSPSLDSEPSPSHPAELGPSLVVSPSDPPGLQHSPDVSPSDPAEQKLNPTLSSSNTADLQKSPVASPSSSKAPRQSPPPSNANLTELSRGPTPSSFFHSEPRQSPSGGTEPQTSHRSPSQLGEPPPNSQCESADFQLKALTPDPTELLASPVPSASDAAELPPSSVVPSSSTTDHQNIPDLSPNVTELPQSLVPYSSRPIECQQSPVPSPNSKDASLSSVQSPKPADLLHSSLSCPDVKELHLSPVPPPSNAKEPHLSPVPSPPDTKDPHLCPVLSPSGAEDPHLSPVPAPPDEIDPLLSPAPSPPDTKDPHLRPVPSPSGTDDPHLCPVPSPPAAKDPPLNPVPPPSDPRDPHLSPTPPPSNITGLHPIPGSAFLKAVEFPQCPDQSPSTTKNLDPPHSSEVRAHHQNGAPSPDAASLRESPVPSPSGSAESPLSLPSKVTDMAQSPNEISEPSPSPVASSSKPAELEQSLVPSPANAMEVHPSPVLSPVQTTKLQENQSPSLPDLTESAQSPASCIAEPQPSPETTPSNAMERPGSPLLFPPEVRALPESLTAPELLQSPVPSPSPVTELHQSPVPSPSNLNQLDPIPSPNPLPLPPLSPPPPPVSEPCQNAVASPSGARELQQNPTPSSHVDACPKSSSPSSWKPSGVRPSPVRSPSALTDTGSSPVPSPPATSERPPRPASSSPVSAERLQSPACPPLTPNSTSIEPEPIVDEENTREGPSPAPVCKVDLKKVAPASPPELVASSHGSRFEFTELHEYTAPCWPSPGHQKTDLLVDGILLEDKEKDSESPIAPICSTPPQLPSVPSDPRESSVLSTSTSPQAGLPWVDRSGEDLATGVPPESVGRDCAVSALGCHGDEAKPQTIHFESRELDVTHEAPMLQIGQGKCLPNLPGPSRVATEAGRSPAELVEAAPDGEGASARGITLKPESRAGSRCSARRPRSAPGSPARAPISCLARNLSQPASPAATTPSTQSVKYLLAPVPSALETVATALSQNGVCQEAEPAEVGADINLDLQPPPTVLHTSSAVVVPLPPPYCRLQMEPSSSAHDPPSPTPESLAGLSASVDDGSPSPDPVAGRASSERLPASPRCADEMPISPLSQPGSFAVLTGRSPQEPADPPAIFSTAQSEDTKTAARPCPVSGFESGPCPGLGGGSTAHVHDSEPPHLARSGRSGPTKVSTCSNSPRTEPLALTSDGPAGCTFVADGHASQSPKDISEVGGQSSFQTPSSPQTTAGPPPIRAGEMNDRKESDSRGASPDEHSVIGGSLIPDGSSNTPPESPSCPPGASSVASQAVVPGETPQSVCSPEKPETPHSTGAPHPVEVNERRCWNPRGSPDAELVQIPEAPVSSLGTRVHPEREAVLTERESAFIMVEQREHLHLHQKKEEAILEEGEEEEQQQQEQREGKKQEKNSERDQIKEQNRIRRSPGEPAASPPIFSTPASPSSPSPKCSEPPSPGTLGHGDVAWEVSPPLGSAPGAPSSSPEEAGDGGRRDSRAAGPSPEIPESRAAGVAGPPERGGSTPDWVSAKPDRREAGRESSTDGETEPSLDAEVMMLLSSSSVGAGHASSSSVSPPSFSPRSLRPPHRSLPPSDELSIRLRQSPFSTEASPETSPARVPLTPPPLSPLSPPLGFSPPYRESPPLCEIPPTTVIPLTRKIGMGKPAISKRKFSPGRARVRQGSWWTNIRAVSPPSSSLDSMSEGGRDSPKARRADWPLWSARMGRGSGFPGRRRSRGGGVGAGRGARGRSRIKTPDRLSVSPAHTFVEAVPPKEEEENSMHNTVVMFSTSDNFTLRQDMCVVCGSFGRGAEGRLLACSQCGQCYHPYCVNVKVTRVILTKGWRCLECTVCEACGQASDPGRLLLCDDCDISYHTYCLDPPLHTVPKGAWKCKWCVWCVQCGSASPGLHCDWQSNYSRCGPCASLARCPLCQRSYADDDLILQCQQCDRWLHAICEGLNTEGEAETSADRGFDCSLCRTRRRLPYGRPDHLDVAQIISRSREADSKTYNQDGVCLTESGLSQLQALVEPLTSARRYRRCKPKLKLRIINQNSVSVLQTPPHPDTGHAECDLKSDSSPERDHQAPEGDVIKDAAKRKRKPYRPGIGGFMVRQRGAKAGPGAIKVCRRDSGEMPHADDGDLDGAELTADKVKKRYRKKKTKLEEAFPSYLQEAFFGRDLLYGIRQVDRRVTSEAARDAKGPWEKTSGREHQRLAPSDDALVDLCDVLHTHILATGPTAGPKALNEEPLDAILNPELDKMVSDGALLSKLYKIPELGGKDVEDLFTAVLSPDRGDGAMAGGEAHAGAFLGAALPNGSGGRAPDADAGGASPASAPARPPNYRPAGDGERDGMSTAKRSMLKWEKEEALGEGATVAPVLYCNTNFPQLREQYPEWSTRVKQIAKLWRKASSQDRAPYVQRARDNRAAQRISKVHGSGEAFTQAPPCRSTYDEAGPQDPLRPRESEQEQEWKLRQGEVKDRWPAGKKRQENTHSACPYQTTLAGGGKEALQMRHKSKQLAKIEATQKLEQVKSEQQQQQRQRQEATLPDFGGRQNPVQGSPLDFGARQNPVQGSSSDFGARQNPVQGSSPDFGARQIPVQGSSPAHDVFLRPQVPPPSGYSSLPHSPRSPHSPSPIQQPPSSPQMFSPPSSRPASPWDPYCKPAGTPRPAQRCAPGISPGHDLPGSPVPSPDSKASDGTRSLSGQKHSRAAMNSPPSGSQVYHRSPFHGGVFRAPVPPQSQSQADSFGARREPQSHKPFPSPCAAAPGTPRADYGHQMAESNGYATPPNPGTPRDGSYLPNLGLARSRAAPALRPATEPGAPQPPFPERIPRSPDAALSSDPCAIGPGTPRPSTLNVQKNPEAFSRAQAESFPAQLARSPLGGEATNCQQSPVRVAQQDSFARTPTGNPAPKHPGISDDRGAAGRVTSGPPRTEETAAGDVAAAAVGASSLEGPMALLPQLGDSEERLRQRQRLRQLILRQQQQKSALRQEKGLRDPVPLAALAGTPPPPPPPPPPASHRWPDVFGRPPPPYPGTPRPPGPAPALPADGLGGPTPDASPFPPQRGTVASRFSPRDVFQHAHSDLFGGPAQTRKPLPGEMNVLRLPTGPGPRPHVASGLAAAGLGAGAPPRAFPVPVQQHSIMGQPYIELRHRAPEKRLRLPFSLPADEDPALHRRDGQNAAPGQVGDVALQAPDGMEEHLEGVDSAVKDLEDVEVKDLVDLNLNLDPEDGKEDLDLGPNDLHLDDFLLSGKFDLIAYADPELNLEDKKDMFNEELELGESLRDRKGPAKKIPGDVAPHPLDEENEERLGAVPLQRPASLDLPPLAGPDGAFGLPGAPGGVQAAGSVAPALTKGSEAASCSGLLPELRAATPAPAPGPQSGFQQRPAEGYLLVPQGLPAATSLHPPCLLLDPPRGQELPQKHLENRGKPLLLEEQPLLLQDLLDQERQEQRQQKQMQALIRHKSAPDPAVPDLTDFGSISDPIMKAKMVALKGINKVMSQGNLGLNNVAVHRFGQTPGVAVAVGVGVPEAGPQPPRQDADLKSRPSRPPDPSSFDDDAQRRQYEEWLGETQRLLQMQQRLLEDQIATHRKAKKALSAKQRTAKKVGRELGEEDAAQLRYVLEQQAAVQKQLEQIRKQQKDHAVLIEDYGAKRRLQRAPANAPASAPANAPASAPTPVPMLPLQSGVQNVPPGWSSAGLMGQNVASHPPPQMPPGLSTPPQVSAVAPGLLAAATTTADFASGGPPGGDVSAPSPLVKFDDNNPFSEGFQERERRERLREQREQRQRVQLVQGVQGVQLVQGVQGAEHQRALLQRLDLDQHRLRPGPGGDALSQMPFFSSELPQDFLQSPPPFSRPGPATPDADPPSPGFAAKSGAVDGPGRALPTPAGGSSGPDHPDISPDDPSKRRRGGVHWDREAGGDRTPPSVRSNDAVPTPALSDASRSPPTRGGAEAADSDAPPSALAPEVGPSAARGAEAPRGSRAEVKEEREERGSCAGDAFKLEPLDGDPGKELLRHLLREKASHLEGGVGGLDLLSTANFQRCKRATPADNDKEPSALKRRRLDDDLPECASLASREPVTHLTQLSALPLVEPVLALDPSPFPPYGSSSPGRDSRLSGSFGNACLDGVADFYAQLARKNILGNPPTPPASLPPTPPPVAKAKLLNGFATLEEVSGKDVQGAASEGVGLRRAVESVDVPASLPTPPHNNQEELRVRDSSPPGSPDGYVPSSSPESVAGVEVSRYPDLSLVKTEWLSPCPSPPIPIMPCSWGKGSPLKREVKTEVERGAPPSCADTDLVTIEITLNPAASQNVPGVMAAVAKLLRVPTSVNYQLNRAPPPGASTLFRQGSASDGRQRTARAAGSRAEFSGAGAAPAVSRPPSCGFCKVLLGNCVRKIKQEAHSGVLFCSPNCSALYSSGGSTEQRPPQHHYANNMSAMAVHLLPAAPPPTGARRSSPPLRFPSASSVTAEAKPGTEGLKVKLKLKPHLHAFCEGDLQHGKRAKSLRCRRWNVNVALSRGPVSDRAVAAPGEEEVDALLKKLGACLRPEPFPPDRRRCCFCHQEGDGETDGPARLLNLDLDLWVHLNCALWSSEVYETQAGALINVELALRRSLALRCAHCQQTGATSGCNRLRCPNTYHFTCALRAHCTFFKDKTMLCQMHRPRAPPSQSGEPPPAPDPYDSELRCFAVFRRVYVQRDEARQVAAMVQRGERRHTFRVGGLLFGDVGRLLPRQMSAFHEAAAIFPVGYRADRIYWSTRHHDRRCKYTCIIEECDARPLFKVKVVEKGYDDLLLTAPTPKGAWEKILDSVARLRSAGGTLKLFPDFLRGEDLFGLSASAVCRIVESLPGVEACERYTFRYGRNPLMEWPLAFNPSGSARSEPKASQAKRPYLPTSTAPRCQGSVGSIVGLVPGVISLSPGEAVAGAHQGRHSKLAQYRRMKADWKTNVYLARSRIQGLGLYAARDIEKCTMVIEYIGAIIRSEVANRKERLYESQNRGVYMFRIDNDYVIDATIAGGPARYVNHSCSPNCITEVVSVEKENKIVISSCRRIQRGEELSYDYKFDLEDDQHKIPCHCGAFNCRKWMN